MDWRTVRESPAWRPLVELARKWAIRHMLQAPDLWNADPVRNALHNIRAWRSEVWVA